LIGGDRGRVKGGDYKFAETSFPVNQNNDNLVEQVYIYKSRVAFS
jgi:hypothetical protein